MNINDNSLHRSASAVVTGLSPTSNQALHVRQVRNTQDTIRRTLDAYGIDDNRDNLSKTRDKYTVFVKKDQTGKPDLSSGVFVSKREDQYGDFKWLGPIGVKKYQAENVDVIQFKESKALDQLGQTYSKTPLPAFLVKILNSEKCQDVELYIENPRLVAFVPPTSAEQHGFLIRPNTPYLISKDGSDKILQNYIKFPEKLKEDKDGIILCSYAIHPEIKSSFLKEKNYNPSSATINADKSTPQAEIDEKTNIKSLTSILSLKPGHLPQLEKLKEATMQHLRDVYHAGEKDDIKNFFHFPVAENTATLHLHTWVNRGDHPLMDARSFHLDAVIEHLRKGKDMSEMILGRNFGTYYLPVADSIKNIANIPFQGERKTPSEFLFPL